MHEARSDRSSGWKCAAKGETQNVTAVEVSGEKSVRLVLEPAVVIHGQLQMDRVKRDLTEEGEEAVEIFS